MGCAPLCLINALLLIKRNIPKVHLFSYHNTSGKYFLSSSDAYIHLYSFVKLDFLKFSRIGKAWNGLSIMQYILNVQRSFLIFTNESMGYWIIWDYQSKPISSKRWSSHVSLHKYLACNADFMFQAVLLSSPFLWVEMPKGDWHMHCTRLMFINHLNLTLQLKMMSMKENSTDPCK